MLSNSTEATIIKHGRRSLGYGFVGFETAAEAEKARKELNKKELEGREVNVEVAKPKTHVDKKPETSSDNESALPRARKSVSKIKALYKRDGDNSFYPLAPSSHSSS